MDRFQARACMCYWKILVHNRHVSTTLTPAQQFEKLFVHHSQVSLSEAAATLAEHNLILTGSESMCKIKRETFTRFMRWPAMIQDPHPFYNFDIKAKSLSRDSMRARWVSEKLMAMPFNTFIGQTNFAILEALWKILGGDDKDSHVIHHEPWLIIQILINLVTSHPELSAGDVHSVLRSAHIQDQWLDKVSIADYPEEMYYQRKQPLRRPIVASNNRINYQQQAA